MISLTRKKSEKNSINFVEFSEQAWQWLAAQTEFIRSMYANLPITNFLSLYRL
jgi:hypothetical protein